MDDGIDIGGIDDIDLSLAAVSGRTSLAQSIARRWLTPPGGLFYDPTYGAGVLRSINAAIPNERQLVSLLEGQALKDERVDAIEVQVKLDPTTRKLTIFGKITDVAGVGFGVEVASNQEGGSGNGPPLVVAVEGVAASTTPIVGVAALATGQAGSAASTTPAVGAAAAVASREAVAASTTPEIGAATVIASQEAVAASTTPEIGAATASDAATAEGLAASTTPEIGTATVTVAQEAVAASTTPEIGAATADEDVGDGSGELLLGDALIGAI